MTREEEQIIIRRVLDGDSNAFEKLLLDNQTNVYNLSLKMLGNPEDAMDASQEAFLRAFRSLDSFQGDSRFSVWLYRLTSNVCIDILRKKRRRTEVSLTVVNDEDEESELEIPDERFSPDAVLDKAERVRAVREGLQKLPEEYRRILTLREISGMSYEELADTLELELGTVKSKLFRARKKLCSILMESGNFSETYASKGRKEV
ncbi:MAG: sigma-70 family RNA polymerase sigma factor [Oscillospiraceae bacterium]|nr:sigma-70 family RNA polymerase sigma factor [Oscillospiraceae bacterium]